MLSSLYKGFLQVSLTKYCFSFHPSLPISYPSLWFISRISRRKVEMSYPPVPLPNGKALNPLLHPYLIRSRPKLYSHSAQNHLPRNRLRDQVRPQQTHSFHNRCFERCWQSYSYIIRESWSWRDCHRCKIGSLHARDRNSRGSKGSREDLPKSLVDQAWLTQSPKR